MPGHPSKNSDAKSDPTRNDGVNGATGTGDRPARSVVDRRAGLERRDTNPPPAPKPIRPPAEPADDATGLERRRGPGRRRTDFTKSAEEGEMTSEQFMFVAAIEAFKKANDKMFPTWTDVLEVVRLLGYRKTMASELNLRNAEDWKEKADAPTGVRSKPGHPEEEITFVPKKREAA